MAHHICPWWVAYLLNSPLRKLLENPDNILSPFVKEGMTVVDYGCAMGFFTLPMARMVGSKGSVIAVDIQERMLTNLMKRAEKAELTARILAATPNQLAKVANEAIDFVAAIHVVHELPDPRAFFCEMRRILKPGSLLLVVEPGFHVSEADFAESMKFAETAGFSRSGNAVPVGRAQVLR